MSSTTTRQRAFVATHLILKREGRVLLQLRQNTGYCDGEWGLISGHVEVGEPARLAMAREAFEEAGIVIAPQDLSFAHLAHTRTNRTDTALFFFCERWKGEPSIRESDKCAALDYFPLDALPEKTVDTVRRTLLAVARGEPYSELGW